MENKTKIFTIAAFLWISVFSISAQPLVVKATIDSTHILIGQQTKIHLEIAGNKEQAIQIPVISDTLMTGVEVLEISKIDTTDIGNNRVQLKYDYLVTSFDSALYLLPPFKVISGVDTSYSNELALKVSTLPVDTESKQFYDIKDVIKPEFVLKDYLPLIGYILLGLILLAAIIYIIYRLVNKKSLIPFQKEEPYVPPHVRAILELDTIKRQKLWQQGRIKEYHSEITDTLRKYIEERFEIGAMEMTSGEILDKIRGYSDADISYDNLKQVLLLADFVKFAKYNPFPDENELSLMNAYLFVNNTKKEEVLEMGENEENEEME
jgi:hypothetical protein